MNKIWLRRLGVYFTISVAVSASTLLVVRARAAGIPEKDALTYTGYLEDPNGAPLQGTHSIAVRLWKSADATKALCAGELGDTNLTSGRFQVPLPADCIDVVKANSDLLVDVQVDGASLGRTNLGAVPYAIEAGHATAADNAPLVTEWTAFTPKWTMNVTPQPSLSTTGHYRRVGDTVEVRARIGDLTTLTSATGLLRIALPNDLVPDLDKLEDYMDVGTGRVGSYNVHVIWGPKNNSFYLGYSDAGGGGSVTDIAPFVLTTGGAVALTFSVPVKGWTSTSP